jgi:phosphatidylserine/phosphatidylglycerophosphate/cardiolipin synthase-like enzyme
VPQNAAFLSAIASATKSIYIQSPDINAQGFFKPLLATCRRGIHMTLVYCLGYNDAGEMLPLQGGQNEYFAHELYKELEEEYHDNLDVYAYVAKDQDKPIHNVHKARSCHVKLMIVDDAVAILGSGNQDSQSWYHSCEVNVVVDSPMVVGRLGEVIRGNQNTLSYGKCAKKGEFAGCWVDADGKMVKEAEGPKHAGGFGYIRGAFGAVNRVRGVGGF